MAELVRNNEFKSRPRESDRTTRAPLPWWDRLKYTVVLVSAFWLFVWIDLGNNPIMPVRDAVDQTIRGKWWIFVLLGLELSRQVHYLLAEHSSAYYLWWTRGVCGGWNRRADRINPWNRYRMARAWKWLIFLVVADIALAKIFDEPYSTSLLKLFSLPSKLFDWLGTFGFILFSLGVGILQFAGIFWFMSKGGVEVYYPDDVQTRFEDVWGQDGVLEKVQENLIFLENPESIESRGGHVPGGILLYGPPGTGKTLMAEAVAGETGNPYVFVEPGAFSNMFFGVGVLKVRSLFKKLRKLALKYGGVIVFFDEADALGNRGQLSGMPSVRKPSITESCNCSAYLSAPTRQAMWEELSAAAADDTGRGGVRRFFMGGMGRGGGDPMALTALLAQISGLKKPRGIVNRYVRRALNMRPKPPPKYRILIMMATNMPDSLDPAFLRPGRIDRIYKVGYPAKEGRKRTFEGYFAKVHHELSDDQMDKLATMSPHATGATIKDMVNEALVNAIRDGRDTITWPDVLRAKHTKEHGIPDDTQHIPRERHEVAIHEACHAIAFYRLHRGVAIDVATIERRGDVGGFVAPIPLEDQFSTWKSEYEVDIMISLASLAGERMFFDGDSSGGVGGGDLPTATSVAMRMEAFLGMGQTVASHLVTKAGNARALGQSVETGTDRQWLETPFGERVEARLRELLARVGTVLQKDRVMVLALAHAMEQHRTISGEDITAIMQGTVGPVVDGRVYHDPAFLEEIEAYHRAALKAHHEFTPVQLALPIPRQDDSLGWSAPRVVPQPRPSLPLDQGGSPPASGPPPSRPPER
jgi:ATP-dependent Zn protease